MLEENGFEKRLIIAEINNNGKLRKQTCVHDVKTILGEHKSKGSLNVKIVFSTLLLKLGILPFFFFY